MYNRRSKREGLEKGFVNLQEKQGFNMPSDQHQQLNIELKVYTCVLKVNVNCHGCSRKVKKILTKIEGVYSVSVDAELQRVTVKGIVDSSTLIKKLIKSGKHAELWSKKSQQKDINQEQQHRNKTKKIDQLMYPNLLGVGQSEDGSGQYEGNQGSMELNAKEMESLLKGISGNAFSGEGNYQNDINNMMQMMGINEHRGNNHQGYDFGPSVKNNFPQFQDYPAGLGAYGYHQQPMPAPVMMANVSGLQYNQNPYAEWLRANPQNMQAIMNNRMFDGYLNM